MEATNRKAEQSDEPVAAPSRWVSVLRALLVSAVVAVSIDLMASTYAIRVPVIILVAMVIFGLVWSFFTDTRASYALLPFVCGGVVFGAVASVAGDRHPIFIGVAFGVVIGISTGISREKKAARRSGDVDRSRRSRLFDGLR